MVQTTRAIVLRTIKHGDKSTVLRVYTERFGLRSYMVRTAAKGPARPAALQPLSRVELVVPEAGEHELRTVRDLRIDRPYTRVQQEPLRGVLMLFAQEVLNRTLREESADAQLYAFVQDALESMDVGLDMAHQPLLLLVGLSRHLGFFPEGPDEDESRFDLREGYFFRGDAPHEFCMEPKQAALFAELIARVEAAEGDPAPLRTSAEVRRRLLDDLLIYYRLHVEGFGELRSLDVLRAVLE
jgi:DNA repair protein RecO (recombination protein O)